MKIAGLRRPLLVLLASGATSTAFAGQSGASNFDGYLGVWDYTVEATDPSPQCGLMRAAGALHVLGRMDEAPGESYAARLAGKLTWEDCPNVSNNYQYAFVRVDGNNVTISYADPSWNPESLQRDGNVMSGSDENGIQSRWEKRLDPDLESRGVEVIANLGENVSIDTVDIQQKLAERGAENVDEERIAMHIEDHYGPCIVNSFRQYAAETGQELSMVFNFIDPVTTNVMRRLYPESFSQDEYDARFKQCSQVLLDELAQTE